MRLAIAVDAFHDDQLILAQQLGVDQVVARVAAWDPASLTALRNRVEKTGLVLEAVEGLVLEATASLDQLGQRIEALGQAGVRLVGYDWLPAPVEEPVPQGRGEALVRRHSGKAVVAPWRDLARVLEGLLPAAERAGVRLACRTAALPGGADDLERLVGLSGSSHGLDLCPEALAVAGIDPLKVIGGAAGKAIFMVQLRNRRRAGGGLVDAFLDEGELSIPRLLQALSAAGFDGPVRAGSPPGMVEDTAWGHKGRSFDLGYLKAILQTLG